jgi:hypothetical protein
MDPIHDLVRDRTDELQRVAENLRRERRLRAVISPASGPAPVVPTLATIEPRPDRPRAGAETDGCASAEHAA